MYSATRGLRAVAEDRKRFRYSAMDEAAAGGRRFVWAGTADGFVVKAADRLTQISNTRFDCRNLLSWEEMGC
jgi:hypothetical protein